jgi:RHS repeat-associated protein
VLTSSSGFSTLLSEGRAATGHVPVPATDFDGDGRANYVVYRPSTRQWFVKPSGGSMPWSVQSGASGNVAVQPVVAPGVPPTHPTVYGDYDHLDALGSARTVTGELGTVLSRHDSLLFGEEWTGAPSQETGLFTGQDRDVETGLDDFGARYYGARIARFTTVDPVMTSAHLTDPQTFNRYAYARNNPLRYVDLDGRDVSKACIADKKCTIRLKVNVIYDQRHPLTDEQKAAMEKAYLQKAQADYRRSNIQVEYTYTEGRMIASDGKLLVQGARSDMLNAVFTTGSEASVYAGGAFNNGTLFVNVAHPDASESNWFLRGNTFEHEMAHIMRGGTRTWLSNLTEDSIINTSLLMQSLERSISAFREGLEHRVFAVEANPAARVPKQ